MMTRYFAATAALLISITVQTSEPNIRRSRRLAEKEREEVILSQFKAPEAYTSPSQCMQRQNGKLVPSRTLKKNHTFAGPRIKNEESAAQEAADDLTTSFSHISFNNMHGNTFNFPINIGEEIEEMIVDDEILPTITLSLPSLPLVNMVVENDTVEMRNPLLTVAAGGVTKPRKNKAGKGLSRSMPQLGQSAASSSTRSSLPVLRDRGPKKATKRTATEELMQQFSQINTIAETQIAQNQPLDPHIQALYARTKNSEAGISNTAEVYLEARKFETKKILDGLIKLKKRQ